MLLLVLSLLLPSQVPAPVPANSPAIEVYFSPRGGAEAAILREIESGCATVRVMAYDFSSRPIAEALIAARGRGLLVELIVDPSEVGARASQITHVANHGVRVYCDRTHTRMHNKVILIDDSVVLTGSYNFSATAEARNVENLLVIRSAPSIAARYVDHFRLHRDHSTRLKPVKSTATAMFARTPSTARAVPTVAVAPSFSLFGTAPSTALSP